MIMIGYDIRIIEILIISIIYKKNTCIKTGCYAKLVTTLEIENENQSQ